MVNQVSVIRFAGMPANAEEVAHAGHVSQFETYGCTYIDRNGDIIDFRSPQSDKLRCDIGYYQAMWDLRGDNLRLDDSRNGQPQLYARDLDLSGEFKTIHSWHVVTSIETEYGIPRNRSSRGWTTLVRLMLRDRPKLIRGIAVNDKCFLPTSGKAIARDVQPGEEFWLHEYTNEDNASKVLATADAILRQVTNDEHSYENLRRSFATPFLEPYKELSYILYGGGGNGKGILLNALKRAYPNQAAIIDVDRLGRATGFSGEQAARDIIGRYWAIDPEADVIDERSMTQIKRLSTGDPMNARGIGENTVTFSPKATLLVATNNPVITAQGAASDRRMVYIRMRDGHVENGMSFDDISRFVNEHGFLPFLILSATAWTMPGSMTRRDVSIGSPADLEDAEAWLRDRICSDGYAIQSENPYGRLPRGCANKLGLKRSTRMVDGTLCSVYVINDEKRFSVYRPDEPDNDETVEDDAAEVTPPPSEPLPISSEKELDPNEIGFPCRFAQCGDDKKAIDWKRNTEDGGLDRDVALGHERTYAVVPNEGSIVLDFDVNDEDGEPDGWDLFSHEVGNYGTEAFPRTFLVRTPSGGAHAYYRIPKEWRGRIKNAAHPKDQRFKAGLPIDTRLERKGYVVGAMSQTESGDYTPVDKPESMVPELTEPMLAWLRDHDYMERSKPVAHDARTLRRLASQKDAKPDMSVVPEGQRNTVLHDWALGRYINHPENRTNIHDDLMERARISGLPESEAETIWRSILDYVGD